MVFIFTQMVEEAETEYLLRAMATVANQSHKHWRHILLYAEDAMLTTIREFIRMQPLAYQERVDIFKQQKDISYSLTSMLENVENTPDTDFITYLNVKDHWSPLFLQKMIFEYMHCPYEIAGVWSQYNKKTERVKGKIIQTTSSLTQSTIPAGLATPSLKTVLDYRSSHGLYSFDIDVINHMLKRPYTDTSGILEVVNILSTKDILILPESLAFIHDDSVNTFSLNMYKQYITNIIIRKFPCFLNRISNDTTR